MRTTREVLPLELGDVTTPDWHPIPNTVIPIRAFVVTHEEGPILFETGVGSGSDFIDEQYQSRSIGLEAQLAERGFSLGDIVAVVNSHLHFDHSGLNRLFPGRPIVAQSAEYEAAHEERYTIAEWIDFEDANYRQIAGDLELAEGVTVISTPGHAPGHQSMTVETARGLEALVGQAAEDLADYEARLEEDESLQRIAALEPTWLHFSHAESVQIAAG